MWRRRAVFTVVASILSLMPGAGAALAATLIGTDGPDRISGTARADWIDARAGNDRVSGGGGEDRIRGGPGNDVLRSGDDQSRDHVDCGPGFDTVTTTVTTTVAPISSRDVYRNCESRSIPHQPEPRGQRTTE